MEQEYWTIEHAERIEDKVDEAQRIYEALELAQTEHERGGTFFKTTKRLLETYRPLRFDAINEKMLRTVESVDSFDPESNLLIALDAILSMPEIYEYYSKEVRHFVSSSIPITMGLFVHMVDAGIRILSFVERNKENELKYSEILKAVYIDEEKDPHALVTQFNTNWATFYRKKNEAITALSIIIFGPLGGRHPSTIFDDNKLTKKYGHFVEMADKIDLICDLASVTEKHS